MKFTTDFLRMIAPGKWYVATATYDGRYELAKRDQTLPFALNTFHIRRVLETSPSNTFLVDLISTKRPGESISLYLDYGDKSIELLPDPINESKPLQSEGQEKWNRRFRDSVKRYADLSCLSDVWLWGKMLKPCAGIQEQEPVFFKRGNEGIRLLSTIRPVVALITDGDDPVAYKPVPGGRFAFPFNQGRIEQLWLKSNIQARKKPNLQLGTWYRFRKTKRTEISFNDVSIQPEELVNIRYEMDGVGPIFEIAKQDGTCIKNVSADIINSYFDVILFAGQPEEAKVFSRRQLVVDAQTATIGFTIMARTGELDSPDNTVRNGKRRSVARVTIQADPDPDGDPRHITAIRVDPDPHGGEREI